MTEDYPHIEDPETELDDYRGHTVTHTEPDGTCQRCDCEIDGYAYLVAFGEYGPESPLGESDEHGFRADPTRRLFCQSCYNERFQREKGAHYRVESAERLFTILTASDGELVADTKAITLGGRAFVRVSPVTGVQCLSSSVEPYHHGEDPMVRVFHDHVDDFTEDDFFDLFDPGKSSRPTIAILRPIEETPYGDVTERGGDSHRLDRWSA